MAVLVIADHDNASLKDNTHKTVTAAKALSGDVDILVAGQGVAAVAAEAAKIEGVRKVLVAESDQLGKQIAEAVTAAVLPLAANYDAILIPATAQMGKRLAWAEIVAIGPNVRQMEPGDHVFTTSSWKDHLKAIRDGRR